VWSDLNACFEFCGALLAWRSAGLAKLERPAGVAPSMVAFSALWAVECVPYYLEHNEYLTAVCAGVRCAGHVLWSFRALSWACRGRA